MARDDLTINLNDPFRRHHKMPTPISTTATLPPQLDHHYADSATILDEWSNRVANLPAEIAFMQAEIASKETHLRNSLAQAQRADAAIQKWIKTNGSHIANPKEKQLTDVVTQHYEIAKTLQMEKVALARKTQLVIDKHTRWLDGQIKILQDRGDFPNDGDVPSLLKPQPLPDTRGRTDNPPSATLQSPATSQPRQPSTTTRPQPTAAQLAQLAHSNAASPVTPTAGAAAAILLNRNTRETSLPATKRNRLNSSLGHLPPSSLARHASLTPGTPRASTPGGPSSGNVRAGSAGPRAQKTIKKSSVSSGQQSSSMRPGGAAGGIRRKNLKTTLARLKRPGKQGSPTSAGESELSDADTGSAIDDDNDTGTPRDVDMLDDDEEEGADSDNRKYCMCQSVSYGDMVACDNESCPFEWFHWGCVGLKAEPVGTWICPLCEKGGKKGGN